MLKQIIFREEDGTILGGFLTDSGKVICGCCGDIIEDAKIVKVKGWIDLNEIILDEEELNEEEEK